MPVYCACKIEDRKENESQREWMEQWMCNYHWMQTDYYRAKLELDKAQNGNSRDAEEKRNL